MAMRVNAGVVKRDDGFAVDPFQLIVRDELRGRCREPDREKVERRAASMLDHEQLQPIQVRRVEDDRLEVVLGFTRCAAAKLIREGFTDPTTGQWRQNKEFMLRVRVVICNDEVAFVRNVVENAQRDGTSPIDDAHNQQKLRAQMAKTNEEIASFYGYSSTNKVLRLEKLLSLDDKIQEKIHRGEMSVDAGLDLLDIPPAERQSLMEEATSTSGKVKGSSLRKAVRDRVFKDTIPESGASPEEVMSATSSAADMAKALKPRTLRDVKVFFQGQVSAADTDPAVARFSKEFLEFVAGKRSDKAMMNSLDRLLESLPERKEG